MFALCRSILNGNTGDGNAVLNVHPVVRVGVACTDEALRAWVASGEAQADEALQRRGATLLWWGPRAAALPSAAGWPQVDLGSEPNAETEATLEALLALPADRFVVVVTAGIERFLPFFSEVPGLRDRVRAVVLIGVDLSPVADWLAESFTHATFDLEMDRALPWLTLRTGPGQVLRTPADDATGRNSVEVVDLGEVDPSAPGVGPALLLVLAALA